jgi:8-oxo-dGTP pyrophosphatase MutT (NUDIX family)
VARIAPHVRPGPRLGAIKEAWEEIGIKARITGLIGDREGDMTLTRYYLAEREAGEPHPDGKESDGVALVPPCRLDDALWLDLQFA